MGMFDYINYECVCPVCKNKIDGFQSKDSDCVLDMLETEEVNNFYKLCDFCGVWVEFFRTGENKFMRTVEGKVNEKIPKYEKEVKIK